MFNLSTYRPTYHVSNHLNSTDKKKWQDKLRKLIAIITNIIMKDEKTKGLVGSVLKI